VIEVMKDTHSGLSHRLSLGDIPLFPSCVFFDIASAVLVFGLSAYGIDVFDTRLFLLCVFCNIPFAIRVSQVCGCYSNWYNMICTDN
jgi:hypothetical protein